MTRDEIEVQYKVENGMIRSPGKFEGEPVWAPHYFEVMLDGCADDEESGDSVGISEETLVSVFKIDASDVETWPELRGTREVRLWEDDQGFVHTQVTSG